MTTDSLILKRLNENDISAVYDLMTNQDAAELAGFRPMRNISEAEGRVHSGENNWSDFGIYEKDYPNELIGLICYDLEEKASLSTPVKVANIAYFLRKERRGKGYMTEALRSLCHYLFTLMECNTLRICVYPHNDASKRVALKCGFKYIKTKKRCCKNGLGKVEDLEFYSLTHEEFMLTAQGDDVKISVITPGKKLSDECKNTPTLVPFHENGKNGLMDENGQVIFPAAYDQILQWPESDVVMTSLNGSYRYYNTSGEEILKDIVPLDGIDDGFMPYYTSEEQSRPELITFTHVSERNDDRTCMIKEQWVRLGRVLRKDVRKWLGSCRIIPFHNTSFDDFKSPFTYIYAAFEASATGENATAEAVDKLRKMGCFDSSWAYLTNVAFHPDNGALAEDIRVQLIPLEQYLDGDMHRVAVGADDTLDKDEVRIKIVRYFKDRWPLDEELAYKSVIMEGSLQQMCAHRNLVLNAINERSRPDVRVDMIRDFLTVWEKVPGEIYRSTPEAEIEDKTRTLFSYTGKERTLIWDVIISLFGDLAKPDALKMTRDEMVTKAMSFIKWLTKEGLDINCVHSLRTPLDLVVAARLRAHETKDSEGIRILEMIESSLKEMGALTLQDFYDEPATIMNRIYPFMNR